MKLTLSPSEIRYSQDSISNKFFDGTLLTSTFALLISGQQSVTKLPKIECVQKEGSWYTASGNRRLFLYKKLQEAGVLSSITVSLKYKIGRRKFTTKCSGTNIRCRGSMLEYQIQEIISKWKKGEDVTSTWVTAPVSSFSTYRDVDFDPYDDYDPYDDFCNDSNQYDDFCNDSNQYDDFCDPWDDHYDPSDDNYDDD